MKLKRQQPSKKLLRGYLNNFGILKLALSFALVFVLGLLFFISPQDTKAENANSEAECDFTSGLEELMKVQENSGLDYITKIREELAVRKTVLSKVLSCTISETDILDRKIDQIKINDSQMSALKARLKLSNEQTKSFYKKQQSFIPTLGIAGTKLTAKSVLEWRSGNYSQTVSQTVSLTAWNDAQNLISLADKKLKEVIKSVKTMEEGERKERTLALISGTEDYLEKAAKYNDKAKQLILNDDSSAEKLSLIKSSLEMLSLAYEGFFKMSEVLADK